MIKKLFTLGLVVASLGASAQQFKKTTQVIGKDVVSQNNWASKINHVASTYSVTVDTLRPASIATSTACGVTNGFHEYLAYSTQDSGYIFGNAIANTFTYNIGTVVTITATTSELAQKYNVGSSAATISGVLVLPGVGTGTATTTNAKIYGETAVTLTISTTPLGTSAAVPMSAYAAAIASQISAQNYFAGMVSYTFATPVAVAANANFYASVTVPAFGGADADTMAVLTTKAGCSSGAPDSLSWMATKYVIPTVGTQVQWSAIRTAIGAANNLDLMIFPIINITSAAGINDYVRHGDLSLYAASPNPASNSININFSVEKSSKVEIEIYDVTGKIVKSVKNNDTFAAGKNSINVDLANLEAGSYLYSINANGNKMFSKFVVTK